MEYETLTKRAKGRINTLIQNRMDVSVSRMIDDATDEADLVRMLDEVRTPPVNPEVKMWTVREVV